MKILINKFKRNSLLTSLATLMSGSIIAQVITILLSPIVTRLFTPDEFGYYTIIITAVSLFGPIICLKYDMAIMGVEKEGELFSIIKLCFYIIIPLSLILSIVYSMLVFDDNHAINQKLMIAMIIFILLSLYGFNNVFLAHNNREKSYKLIASVTIYKSTVNNILLIITGWGKAGALGLVSAQILSSLVGIWRQSTEIRKKVNMIKSVSFYEMKKVFKKNIDFLIFNSSSALITTTVYSSINIFIAISFSVQQLGYYSLSYRILGIPFMIISANVARVFFERATNERNESGEFNKTFKSTIKIISVITIPTLIIIAIVSPYIFPIIFGKEWGEAGFYVSLLAPMFAIRLISESLTTSFIVAGRQKRELLFQFILMLVQIILYIFTIYFKLSIELFLILISLLYVTIHSIMIIYMMRLSSRKK